MGDNACDRALKYYEGLMELLGRLGGETFSKARERGLNVDRLMDAIKRYASDAKYYVDIGDCETALVSISYAEGLLDALNYLGLANIVWSRSRVERRKVFVAGTFEVIHPGHISLFKYASTLGDVYVVVARDRSVERFKGRRPIIPENVRLEVVKAVKYVKEARLGHPSDILKPIGDIRPDIIVLGPDQPFNEEELASTIESRYGYKPLVLRFKHKESFGEGLTSVRDIFNKVCREFCRS